MLLAGASLNDAVLARVTIGFDAKCCQLGGTLGRCRDLLSLFSFLGGIGEEVDSQ